jgi:hypothetical protein
MSAATSTDGIWQHAAIKEYYYPTAGVVQLLGGFAQYTFPEATHLDALLQLRRHIQSLLRVTIEGSEVLASAFSSSLAGTLGQLLALSPIAEGDWEQRRYFEEMLEYHRDQQEEGLAPLREEREQELSVILEERELRRGGRSGQWMQRSQGQRNRWSDPDLDLEFTLNLPDVEDGGWVGQQQGSDGGAGPPAAVAAADQRRTQQPNVAEGGEPASLGSSSSSSSSSSSRRRSSSAGSSQVVSKSVVEVSRKQLEKLGRAQAQQLLAPLVGKSPQELEGCLPQVLPRLAALLADGTMAFLLLPAPVGTGYYVKVSCVARVWM